MLAENADFVMKKKARSTKPKFESSVYQSSQLNQSDSQVDSEWAGVKDDNIQKVTCIDSEKMNEVTKPQSMPYTTEAPDLYQDNSNESQTVMTACDCAPVLVVDDNEFNLYTLTEVLLTFKLKSKGADNGLVATERVSKSLECCPFKVIFMDQHMPVMDGLDSTKAIRKILDEHMEAHPTFKVDVR